MTVRGKIRAVYLCSINAVFYHRFTTRQSSHIDWMIDFIFRKV